jgi:hypothetical protein
LRRLGYQRLLSTVERGADGITIAPLVKLYTRRMVRTILADFHDVKTTIHGYDRVPLVERTLPTRARKALERRYGWYVVSHATK